MDTAAALPGRLICPTTGHPFCPHAYRVQHIRQHIFLWVWCPCCDSSDRAAGDPNYDAGSPQVHCFELQPSCAQTLLARAVGAQANDRQTTATQRAPPHPETP